MKYKNQYIIKTTVAGDTIEVQKTQSSRYGHAIPRNENIGSTPEAMKKINQINAENTLRQLMNENYHNDDYHLVLTYFKDMRPDGLEEARRELKKILRYLREDAKRLGVEVKYIASTEVGERGAVHHHIVINRVDIRLVTAAFKRRVQDAAGKWEWRQVGTVRVFPLYSNGQYKNLSNYIIKQTSKSLRKAGAAGKRYIASRNLKKPIPKPEVVQAKTWRQEPKPPKGYMFDPAYPLVNGACEVTGLKYQRYGFIKIRTYKERYYTGGATSEDNFFTASGADRHALPVQPH